MNSNRVIGELLVKVVEAETGVTHAIQVVPTTDREAIPVLLSLTQYIDLCMPRGGESLIRAVAECSKVPVIKHYTVSYTHLWLHRGCEACGHPDAGEHIL